jgi:hypothetical protein
MLGPMTGRGLGFCAGYDDRDICMVREGSVVPVAPVFSEGSARIRFGAGYGGCADGMCRNC